MMFGSMQDRPLLISTLIEHAATFHADREIVSKTVEGPLRRTTWSGIAAASKQTANALGALGLAHGDRVATLAWNSDRHLALYFGVSGSGAVLHTVNPRLSPEQIVYILNHAADRVLFFDATFANLVGLVANQLESVHTFVALTDRDHLPAIPEIPVHALLSWQELVDTQSSEYAWPEFDERCASSLCYTSGTTGNPKGVLYSHRSTVLHTLATSARDAYDVHSATSLLLVVPMFHVNGWGMPYSAALVGAKVVLPGRHLDGESIYQLMASEEVTFAPGVPTVWMMLFAYLDQHPEIDPREVGLQQVGSAGSALPLSLIQRFHREFGAEVFQGWGMTETSPTCVVGKPLPKHRGMTLEQLDQIRVKQGRGIWGVDLKIVDEIGNRLPWDGQAFGEVRVRGAWITADYYRDDGGAKLDAEGFLPTGDIATIDADGYLHIVDRAKDVIKSGGEWISSIDLENAVMGHPAIAEAAVIGIPHLKWQERPLLIVVLRMGQRVNLSGIHAYLQHKVAKWWLPDEMIVVDALPHTATGKVLKTALRERYGDHVPSAAALPPGDPSATW